MRVCSSLTPAPASVQPPRPPPGRAGCCAPPLFGRRQCAAAWAITEAVCNGVFKRGRGRGGREGPSERAFPPCLLRVNHTDKPDTPTFFRQAEGVWMTGDVSSRTPMTTSRNMERLPSIMASPRWSCGGSQTTHPGRARNSTQRYVASAWCHPGGQFSKSILVILHRSPFQL